MSFFRSTTVPQGSVARQGKDSESSIYLDHQATTPLDSRVLDRMLPYLTDQYANAASHHAAGRAAAAAVDEAREQVAGLVGGRASGVVFTSGATEANNLAIRGLAEAADTRLGVVTVATEHPSVLEPVAALAAKGAPVLVLLVGPDGEVDLEQLTAALDEQTLVVSVMAANNEIGTLHPLPQIVDIAHRAGALVHCDATQLIGKLPLDVGAIGIDLASMSAHKLYGPKGVGALVLTRDAARRLSPQLLGGGHERGHRSGTLNVPGCVGFGEAAAIAADAMQEEAPRLTLLAKRLLSGIEVVGDVTLNGPATDRLPGNLNVSIKGTAGDDLMLRMPSLAVSTGSACSSASPRPSHVLLAIGRTHEEAASALRFGVGRFTTEEEIDRAVGTIVDTIKTVRTESRGALTGRPA